MFYSAKHREAFNHLLFGIRERKGFVQLTGEVGAGKTTVCRAVMEQLPPTFKTALILNPALSRDQLLRTIVAELGMRPGRKAKPDKSDMLELLNAFLFE